MATERLDIIISAKGAKQTQRAIRNVGKAGKSAGAQIMGLRSALVGLGAIAAARSILSTADAMQNLNNRLKLVSKGTADAKKNLADLFAIAQKTRQGLEPTVQLFQRTTQALRHLGTTADEVKSFVTTMNQAVALSGASAQESNNAIRQFTQGLASGTLRGDELRSVLEQLPTVADIIATSLGVARGELRAIAKAGGLTPKVILKAMKEAAAGTQISFDQMTKTIGQSLTTLQNQWMLFVGEFSNSSGLASGASGVLATIQEGVRLLGENINLVIPAIQTLATIILTRLVQGALLQLAAALIRSIAALRTFAGVMAFATGGISLLVGGMVAVTAGSVAYSTQLLNMNGNFKLLGEAATRFIGTLKGIATAIVNAFRGEGTSAVTTWKDTLEQGAGVAATAINGVTTAIGFIATVLAGASAAWNNFQSAALTVINAIISAINGLLQAIQDAANGLNSMVNLAIKAKNAFSSASNQSELFGTDQKAPNIGGTFDVPKLQDIKAAMDDVALTIDKTATAHQNLALKQANAVKAAEEFNQVTKATKPPVKKLGDTAAETGSKIADMGKKATGAKGAVKDLGAVAKQESSFMGDALGSAFSKASDALANFVATGKLDFKALTASILKDVTKMALNSAFKQMFGGGGGGGGIFGGGGGGGGGGGLLSGLMGGGGGGGGGLLSGLSGLIGFASGGSFEVGGAPGRDNNVMSINGQPTAKVAKGETVTVTPQGGRSGGITIIYNIETPNAASFGESQGQLQAQAMATAQRASSRNN
jgi:tape measure domain-containing protein